MLRGTVSSGATNFFRIVIHSKTKNKFITQNLKDNNRRRMERKDLNGDSLVSQFVSDRVSDGYTIIFVNVTTSFFFAHSTDVSDTESSTRGIASSTNIFPTRKKKKKDENK